MWDVALAVLTLMVLCFAQNVSFTMVSRSRNRDNMTYHAVCSVFSNGLWFLTFQQIIKTELTYWLMVPYIIGTVSGSIFGAKVSMKIEKWLGAKT